MKLKSWLKELPYTLLQGSLETEVDEVVYDSRKAAPGTVFVCMRGANVDSHTFIPDVVEKGAPVLVVEHPVEAPENVTVIQVENGRNALSLLSAARFDYPARKMTAIGVTGTKGKTTTTYMIKAILEAAGYVDTDGDGWRERPDGTPMDVLVTPQYNATKAALYQRIAEIIVTNLGEVGVKCTLDEESIRNSDHEQQLRDDGAYEIYICYATQGVSFYKTPFLYMFNDDLSMWGTCDLEDFDQAYNDMLNAQGDEDYVAKVKELQRIASEEVIGIALCWDTAYYPYRTDKYEGWTNYPGWGVINCETWYSLRPVR